MSRALRTAVVVVVLVGVGLVQASPAQADVIQPTTFADEFNASPPCSLREAIRSAFADMAVGGCPAGSGFDTVQLLAGVYQLSIAGPPEDLGVSGDLDIATQMNVDGVGAGVTVIDGGDIDRVIHVGVPDFGSQPVVTMSGLTIRNGTTDEGGGIFVDVGSSVTLQDVAVLDNEAEGGGGISNAGTMTIERSTVAGNEGSDGTGGIGNHLQGVLTVVDSAIVGNRVPGAGAGGGIRNSGAGRVTLTNVTVSGNDALGSGGGINTSTDPAGFLHLNNVTITGNRAGNTSTGDNAGGGIHGSGEIEIQNSIVAGNLDRSTTNPGPDCAATITSLGHNIIGEDTGCTVTPASGDLIGTAGSPVDPVLGPLADNGGPTQTHALVAGSPALDSAGPGCPPADQRGAPRTGACDRGAYELVFCLDAVVNRVGTGGRDGLRGTSGPDGFLGLAGNDNLRGRGGGDRVCTGAGKDTAAGGSGNDRLLGEQGKDLLKGGAGKDRLVGGPGKDTCAGGPKRDKARSCESVKAIP
jgi:CSLREA domain-containing protein